jgi:hypothetical protein
MKTVIRAAAVVVLAMSTFWNFWDVATTFGSLKPRESNELVVTEKLYVPIRFALWREEYNGGEIAYASPRSFRGEPITEADNFNWAKLRYAAIPINLVKDIRSAPYVIGDFTDGSPVIEAPEGLTKILDPGAGLVLYKRKISP